MILLIGAGGQIGTELLPALQAKYGPDNVLATDITPKIINPGATDPETSHPTHIHALDVLDKPGLEKIINERAVTQIYLLAAMLSATGEAHPQKAWDLNMTGLFNVLEIARNQQATNPIKIFFPSSIAVFGPTSPKVNCPQDSITQPTSIYGISKLAGEGWCQWYQAKYGLDIRSIRYPGLISSTAPPGGGTTDYAVDIFHQAVRHQRYTAFLKPDTRLPMCYMPDAVRATLELMEAPAKRLRRGTAYNLTGMSFTPAEIAEAIGNVVYGFKARYKSDYRQAIADSWPDSIDDFEARRDWGWQPRYNLEEMTKDMLQQIGANIPELEKI